jgi:hypothetical protein
MRVVEDVPDASAIVAVVEALLRLAVTTAVCVTDVVCWAANCAVFAPAATVTEAGTERPPVLLERPTEVAEAAAAVKVTVQVAAWPGVSAPGEQVSDCSVGAAPAWTMTLPTVPDTPTDAPVADAPDVLATAMETLADGLTVTIATAPSARTLLFSP